MPNQRRVFLDAVQTFGLLVLMQSVTSNVSVQQPDTKRSIIIPVVKTWRELRATPVVAKGEFGQARIGIEATSAAQFGGILVYCLVDIANPETLTHFDTDAALGPLLFHTRRTENIHVARKTASHVGVALEAGAKQILYTRAVTIDSPGDYEVNLSQKVSTGADSAAERILATSTVASSPDGFHAWTPLGYASQPQEPEQQRNGDDAFVAYASTQPQGIAVPEHNGFTPTDWTSARRKISDDKSLPKLIPTRVDPSLVLSGGADELIVQSQTPMIMSTPHSFFLARWWVNGEPFKPKPIVTMQQAGGLQSMGKKLRIRLQFDPADLNAKSNDRIGLQLMRVTNGWTHVVSPGTKSLMHFVGAADESEQARLSNQIEFRAP